MHGIRSLACLMLMLLLFLPATILADTTPADTCAGQYPGDLNSDGVIDSLDLTFFWDYWWMDGPSPSQRANADINGDCHITDGDYYYLDAFLNEAGPAPASCTCIQPIPCACVAGDANNTGSVNITDVVHMISYIYAGGHAPASRCAGDTNCDCKISISDAVAVILFIWQGDSLNCQNCDDWLSHCAPTR